MSFGFLIRDGIESDIPLCLSLDSTYTTDYVWQMSLQPESQQQQITFKTERLPRPMDVAYPASEGRLHLSLPPEQCFLVAAARDFVEDAAQIAAQQATAQIPAQDMPEVLGYLTMRADAVHRIALVQDIVVARSLRGNRIGTRLLRVARKWAVEHHLTQLMVETQTKNYPAILFCQKSGLSFCGFNDQYFRNQDIAVFFSQTLH